MAISTAAGVQFFIGSTLTGDNLSQYLSDTFTEIGEVEDLGEFGDESEAVTFASLADARLQKLKGVRDAGTIALVCGSDDSDAGQDSMVVAEASTLDHNFKVVFNDALTVGGTPSENYFFGKVMSKRTGVGTVNNVVRKTFNIGINSVITVVDAT